MVVDALRIALEDCEEHNSDEEILKVLNMYYDAVAKYHHYDFKAEDNDNAVKVEDMDDDLYVLFEFQTDNYFIKSNDRIERFV